MFLEIAFTKTQMKSVAGEYLKKLIFELSMNSKLLGTKSWIFMTELDFKKGLFWV